MTIKWVKVDPLVMNGEPFCFGTRLTVRNILEMRRSSGWLAIIADGVSPFARISSRLRTERRVA